MTASMQSRTELVFTVTFHGPFRIARGEASSGADLTIDPRTPLPASSLKGLMRAAAEHVLRIDQAWLSSVFGADTNGDGPGPVLGNVLDQWCWSDPEIDERSRTIDRSARIRLESDGTVMDRHLLIGEQVWVKEPVQFTVARLGPVEHEDLAAHRLILRASARAVLALGGQRRRGFGWVTITDGMEWTEADSRALLDVAGTKPAAAQPSTGGASSLPASPSAGAVVRLTYRLHLRSAVTAGAGSEVGNGQRGHQVIPGSVVRGALAAAWLRDHGPGDADRRLAALFERDLSIGPAVPVGSTLVPLSHYRIKYPPPGERNDWRDAAATTAGPAETGIEFARGWTVPSKDLVRITRTALNADGTAKSGNLFTETGLRTGVVAVGEMMITTDDAAAVEWLRRPRTLRVGGRRSTGGAVDWTVHDLAGEAAAEGPAGTLLVRCLSPMVIVDEFGAPTADPVAVEATLTEAAGHQLTLGRHWSRTRTIEGWHTASGLPKVAEWAIEAGSVFEVSGLTTESVERLARGVGLRRQEGFGRVEVCSAGTPAPVVADPVPPEATAAEMTPPETASPATTPVTTDRKPVAPERPPVPPSAEPPTGRTPEPEKPPEEAADAAPASIEQRVADLIAAVGPTDAPALLKGLANEARRIVNFRTSGMESVARGAARSALKQTWARAHTEAVQNLIVGLLQDDDVSQVRDVATRRAGEQR